MYAQNETARLGHEAGGGAIGNLIVSNHTPPIPNFQHDALRDTSRVLSAMKWERILLDEIEHDVTSALTSGDLTEAADVLDVRVNPTEASIRAALDHRRRVADARFEAWRWEIGYYLAKVTDDLAGQDRSYKAVRESDLRLTRIEREVELNVDALDAALDEINQARDAAVRVRTEARRWHFKKTADGLVKHLANLLGCKPTLTVVRKAVELRRKIKALRTDAERLETEVTAALRTDADWMRTARELGAVQRRLRELEHETGIIR